MPFYGDGVSSDVAVSYTVIFEEVGGGWIQARLHELPAVVTAAPSASRRRRTSSMRYVSTCCHSGMFPSQGASPGIPPTPSN